MPNRVPLSQLEKEATEPKRQEQKPPGMLEEKGEKLTPGPPLGPTPQEKPREVGAPRVILKVTSAWPWELSPDTLIIDEVKVTVTHHIFLSSGSTRQIKLADVANISMISGPIFASISMYEKGFGSDVSMVKRLWRNDAVRARRILQGISVLTSEKVDFSQMTVDEIISRAEKAGEVVEVV
ncbi:hypothetical protein M1403_03075 [Patescibacteria group bacterium]|nr:hypothetical protein [Patescibacteria group bacterium]